MNGVAPFYSSNDTWTKYTVCVCVCVCVCELYWHQTLSVVVFLQAGAAGGDSTGALNQLQFHHETQLLQLSPQLTGQVGGPAHSSPDPCQLGTSRPPTHLLIPDPLTLNPLPTPTPHPHQSGSPWITYCTTPPLYCTLSTFSHTFNLNFLWNHLVYSGLATVIFNGTEFYSQNFLQKFLLLYGKSINFDLLCLFTSPSWKLHAY